MTVTFQLFATYRELLPQKSANAAWAVDIVTAETVRGLRAIRRPNDAPRLVLVNGKYAADHEPLAEGDQGAVCPPLMGGSSWCTIP